MTAHEIRKAIRDTVLSGGVYHVSAGKPGEARPGGFITPHPARIKDVRKRGPHIWVQLLETGVWERVREGDKIEVRTKVS